jgi:hypothetical protein
MVPGEWWNRLLEGELCRSMEEREHVPLPGKKFADLEIKKILIKPWLRTSVYIPKIFYLKKRFSWLICKELLY